ncbi:TVP38/TMEM64 family protein [Cohnella sp. WQ 127256]|uniref:TVP38/TMEM64 family protein n=1 Tax=Cohnella sp. WQ 127256 TaxID=2938790 RepID=UPI00211814C6|nr:TVP38/TMEM64 family protein [Cohnella sp. WQ 127256]
MKTTLVGLSYLVSIIMCFIYKNEILHWLQEGYVQIALVFLIAVGFILFPVMPFKIIIGILGYSYGTLLGAFISWLAASVGSVIIYLIVKTFFQQQGRAYLAKFNRLEKLHQSIEQQPFWTIVIARMIPIVPQSVVNLYAPLLSIRLLTYAIASAVGKIPAMLVYAYIGQHFISDKGRLFMAIGIYILFLLLTYLVYRYWFRKQGSPA